MIASLFSLVSLTVAAIVLVLWVWSPRTKKRWEAASQLPFTAADDRTHGATTHD